MVLERKEKKKEERKEKKFFFFKQKTAYEIYQCDWSSDVCSSDPSVAEFLTHLRGLRPKNRIMGAFGSYGWGGGAVKEAYEEFKKMKIEILEPGIEVLYRPSMDDESKCYEFGGDFAKKVKEYHKNFE